jgi:hypothetical protein
MANKPKIEAISQHRGFARNYLPKEFAGEVRSLVECGDYEDFMLIATGDGGRVTRVGSSDGDLRYGDLFYMLEMAKQDLLEIVE